MEQSPLFVIGQATARRYVNILDQCAAVWLARSKAGLDDSGRSLQEPRSKLYLASDCYVRSLASRRRPGRIDVFSWGCFNLKQ